MRYMYDLHLHSDRSHDSVISSKLLFTRARELGLSGFAVTDHDLLTRIRSSYRDIIVFPGMELTVGDPCVHIIALGVQEPVDPGSDVFETIDNIHDLNGVAVAPHPFSSKPNFPGVGDLVYDLKDLDGIEVTSPRDHVDNQLARKVARTLNLAKVGGSDAHHPMEMGSGYTITREPMGSVDDLISQIQKRMTDGSIK